MKLILVVENDKCDRQGCDKRWVSIFMKPWGAIRLCKTHSAEEKNENDWSHEQLDIDEQLYDMFQENE